MLCVISQRKIHVYVGGIVGVLRDVAALNSQLVSQYIQVIEPYYARCETCMPFPRNLGS
jgi:hypothetical protein